VELEIGPVATFHPVTPVVYLAVSGDVGAVASLRDAVLAGPLDRPPAWPFVPHVTLADGVASDRISAAVAALGDYRAVVGIGSVHMLQEGPDRVWRTLSDVELGRPAIVGRGGLPVELAVSDGLDPEGRRLLGAGPDGDGSFAVTARREGRVAGVAVGVLRPGDELVLDRLVVAPDVRGQGIGGHLLSRVELLAAEHKCRRAVFAVEAGGPAEAFSRGRGWEPDLVLPGWRDERDFVRLVRRPAPAEAGATSPAVGRSGPDGRSDTASRSPSADRSAGP
jgi:GNAT superfamily N-acetyltransferase